MSAATNPPMFRDAAHRRAVMRNLAASIAPSALAFGALAPVIGLLLVGARQLAELVSSVVSGEVHFFDAVASASTAVLNAWLAAGIAAAIAGVWIAMLSPFAPKKLQFYAGVTAIGVVTAGLFLFPLPAGATITAGPLLTMAGAVSIAACARMFTNWPLGRGEDGRRAGQDRLARERAARLAKARAAG
jgi:hypothetical protein